LILRDDYIKYAERTGKAAGFYKEVAVSIIGTQSTSDLTAETMQKLFEATENYEHQLISKDEFINVSKNASKLMEDYYTKTKVTIENSSVTKGIDSCGGVASARKCPNAPTSTTVFGASFTCPSSVICSDGKKSSRMGTIAFYNHSVPAYVGPGCSSSIIGNLGGGYSTSTMGVISPIADISNGGYDARDATTCHGAFAEYQQYRLIAPLTQYEEGVCSYIP
jgi:hypothetical protein